MTLESEPSRARQGCDGAERKIAHAFPAKQIAGTECKQTLPKWRRSKCTFVMVHLQGHGLCKLCRN